MPLPLPLEELFQFEYWLEAGFNTCLTSKGLNPTLSRSNEEAASPYTALWVEMAGWLEHRHIMANGTVVFDAFTAILYTEIVTHRRDDQSGPYLHAVYLGKARAALQKITLVPVWNALDSVILVSDIREGATLASYEDENNLDHSLISWQLVVNVHPDAWPASY